MRQGRPSASKKAKLRRHRPLPQKIHVRYSLSPQGNTPSSSPRDAGENLPVFLWEITERQGEKEQLNETEEKNKDATLIEGKKYRLHGLSP